jgi:very-short-patch-repair endonuclease
VAGLAAKQHGVVARRQLIDLDVAGSTVDRWVHQGHLHRLHRAVYAVGHRRIPREGIWMAAVLACPRGSVLSHGPSGQLQGFLPRRERFALHVTLPRGSGGSPPGIVTHRPRQLDPADTTVRWAVPCTTATRTLFDLAPQLPSVPLCRAFRQAEKLELLDRRRLRTLLDERPNQQGSTPLRQLLAERPLPLSEVRSILEEIILETCAEHRLPLPVTNVPVLGYEVDFLWPDEKLIIEADGGDHVGPKRDDDNERDAEFMLAGYLPRRYGWRAAQDRHAVSAQVVRLLQARPALSPTSASGGTIGGACGSTGTTSSC